MIDRLSRPRSILPNWVFHETHARADRSEFTAPILGAHDDFFSVWKHTEKAETYLARFAGVAEFEVSVDDHSILIQPASDAATPETLDHLLTDQIIPRVLAHSGAFVLHAGAIKIEDGLILIAGDTGLGKSTLTASFAQAGFEFVSDDVMILSIERNTAIARALCPDLRIYPDSINALFDNQPFLAPMASYSTKMHVRNDSFQKDRHGSLPIRAIFMLGRQIGASVEVQRLEPSQFCIDLIANSFALDPGNHERALTKLEFASQLVSRVSGYQLCYPRSYSMLPEVHEAVLHSLQSQGSKN